MGRSQKMSSSTLYKIRKVPRPLLNPYHHYLPMDTNNYLNLHDTANVHQPPPRSRQSSGLLGSIWAPQPQPGDTTWPRALDSFSREAEQFARPDASRGSVGSTPMQHTVVSREDVFGSPQPQLQSAPKVVREVGAIGDGRKKNSPEFGDSVSFVLAAICLISDILACAAC